MNGIANINEIVVPAGYRVPELHHVFAITRTLEERVYIVDCEITDMENIRERVKYALRPNDPFGLAPTLRMWMVFHPWFPIGDYVPPTIEEIRADMLPLSNFHFRNSLIECGVTVKAVDVIIRDINEEREHEKMLNAWQFAPEFRRTGEFVTGIAHRLTLSDEQVDAIWQVGLQNQQGKYNA